MYRSTFDSWKIFFSKFTPSFGRYRRRCQKSSSRYVKNCFLYFSTKMAEIQKMSLASENTLETEYFMPLNHFSNFNDFRGTQHFMWFWRPFLNPKTRGGAGWIWHFWAAGFDGDVKIFDLVEFGVGNTIKKWRGLNKTSRFFGFFSVFLVNFRGFLASQLKNI